MSINPQPGKTNSVSRGLAAALLLTSAFAVTLAPIDFPFNSSAYAEAVRVERPQMPSFADVVEAVSPAVVSVRIESDLKPASDDGGVSPFFDEDLPRGFRNNPFFRDHPYFREGPRGERREGRKDDRRSERRDDRPRRFGMSQGSGFFISEDGFIVTNHHVVENGSKFTIVMNDGTEHEATLVGADARTDLAVLKVTADTPFKYVKLSEAKARIGDWVVAVGNPFGLGGTVTAGIISAHNREISANRYDDFIQIDAAVNKGSSGGPAFDLSGEVIGINTAIYSPSGGNVGIAFAIPATTASEVIDDLMKNGQVVRGWLGVQIQPVTRDIAESVGLADASGAIVTGPQDESPAAKAGIKAGDIITDVNGDKIRNPRDLARRIGNFSPDEKVKVGVWRDGKQETVEVTLGTLSDTAAAASGQQRTEQPARGLARLGLEVRPSDDGAGVVVSDVVPGSNADRKGIRAGDVIVSVNGDEVTSASDIADALREADSGGRKSALFQLEREGNSVFVGVPLARS